MESARLLTAVLAVGVGLGWGYLQSDDAAEPRPAPPVAGRFARAPAIAAPMPVVSRSGGRSVERSASPLRGEPRTAAEQGGPTPIAPHLRPAGASPGGVRLAGVRVGPGPNDPLAGVPLGPERRAAPLDASRYAGTRVRLVDPEYMQALVEPAGFWKHNPRIER